MIYPRSYGHEGSYRYSSLGHIQVFHNGKWHCSSKNHITTRQPIKIRYDGCAQLEYWSKPAMEIDIEPINGVV